MRALTNSLAVEDSDLGILQLKLSPAAAGLDLVRPLSMTTSVVNPPPERPQRPAIDTKLLMALAAILVANSHLEQFYPRAWLAGDGLLGNSIFFFLAGFGLVRSEISRTRSFTSWFWRRIVRIYPSVFLVMLVFGVLIGGDWRTWKTVFDPLSQMVWPTRYTFVAMIFPFYFLFFPLLRLHRSRVFAIAVFLMCFTYVAAYASDVSTMSETTRLQLSERPYVVHASAYFQAMVLGGWCGVSYSHPRLHIRWRLLATAVLFLLYVAAKYMMITGRFARAYGILHLFVAFLCVFLFDTLCSPEVVGRLKAQTLAWQATSFVAGLTLEVYIVHLFIAEYRWVWSTRFPLNLALFWALTLPLAWLVGHVSRRLQRELRRERLEPAVTFEPGLNVQP